MNSVNFVARTWGAGVRFLAQFSRYFFCLAAVVVVSSYPAYAQQQQSIINKGDAVVTGYSGVVLLKPAAGSRPEDYAIINQQGAVLQVFDMSQMFGRADAHLVAAPRHFSVTAGRIGQVFGVTLDDGLDSPGTRKIPNIYATATSTFGLQLVKTAAGVRNRAKAGGPNRTFMAGQWGARLGGGPGSIWKIDGRTGEVSLFADVKLNGRANSGPALGNITFDARSRQLFVSDMQTGMIHAYNLDGAQVDVFDHGVKGRPRMGLRPVAYDPAQRKEITQRSFKALQPSTWGFAAKARRVWGLGVSKRRLFYSVAEGPEVWSVGIKKNGRFANDPRVEIEIQGASSDPISDITFARGGTMYLAQRGLVVASYDYTVFAKPKTAAVLRYRKRKLPNGRWQWRPLPEEYAVGFPAGFRSGNGGVALGYGYDRYGFIRYGACQAMLWSTGELLRQNARLKSRLAPGGPMIVHGLQGNRARLVRPQNEAPFKTYFLDFDSHHLDPSYKGHMGDVEIWSSCRRSVAPLKEPVGPRIRITKTCSPGSFGGHMHCRVTLTNTGSAAAGGRVGFTDRATVLKGGPGAGAIPLILSVKVDDEAWRCSALPANKLNCSIEGAVLEPGHHHSVDIVMDISGLIGTPNWRLRNCARLNGSSTRKCVWRGESDALVVLKSGPLQQPCIGGGPCDFQLTVANFGKRTFDGELFFGDNLTIGGAAVGGIIIDGIAPTHGCAIVGAALPLEWKCHVTIAPGDQRTFNLLLTIPVGAGPAAGIVQGRNCFVASDPHLVLAGGAPPANFWANVLDPLNLGTTPGATCVNFAVQAPLPNQIIPPRVIVGLPDPGFWGPLPGAQAAMQMTITANPDSFANAGELIKFQYEVLNTGNVPILTFTITDNKTSPGVPVGNCDRVSIAVGQKATCSADYTTVLADKNTNIITTATVEGTY